MMEQLKDRVIGSGKVSSVVGLVVSAAVPAAAKLYESSGGAINAWGPYAASAGIAVAGALWKRNKK